MKQDLRHDLAFVALLILMALAFGFAMGVVPGIIL
jgi:hypothetical protein